MTVVQAQSVISAIIGAGYNCKATFKNGEWFILAESNGFNVDVNIVRNLAIAQGVSAFVAQAEFS